MKTKIARVLVFIFLCTVATELCCFAISSVSKNQITLDQLKEDSEDKSESKEGKNSADKKVKHVHPTPAYSYCHTGIALEYYVHFTAKESSHILSSPTPPPDCIA